MEKDVRDIELIDEYLEGTLSESEQSEVEQRLKSDSDFAELLDDFKIMRQGIELSGMEKQLNKLKEVDKEMGGVGSLQSMVDSPQPAPEKDAIPPKENGHSDNARFKRRRLIGILSAAASVVLLVGVGLWMMRSGEEKGELFAMEFALYLPDMVTSRDNLDKKSPYELAMDEYQYRNFKGAIKHFESDTVQAIPNKYNIYYAISLLMIKAYTRAESALEKYLQNQGDYADEARYYLELSKIGQRKIEITPIVREEIKSYYNELQNKYFD